MKIDAKELGAILDHSNPPDYIQWHRERIISCVDFLRESIPLADKRTLDLGHDVHVGSLLASLGCILRGNVAPDGMGGHEDARESASFSTPSGAVHHWGLDAFDFEGAFPYPAESFDVVTTMEVIEHVSISPREFLREIKRVLVPGGHLFIGTPNAASWTKMMRSFAHGPTYDAKPYSQNFGPRHPMCHVYEYTPWELKELLTSEGFEITSFGTWDPYPSDARGVRSGLLKFMLAGSMAVLGYLRFSALLYRNRGHQMGLVAKLKA
jgi:SAM-dependent methyltransferase